MKTRNGIAALAMVSMVSLSVPLSAQMVAFEAGGLKGTESEGNTYSWRMEYRQPLGDGWGVGLGWLNEGHLPDHHRDGQALQLWKYWQPRKGRLMIGLGAGVYHFYDTKTGALSGYENEHGYRGLFTLSALYAFGQNGRWIGLLEINRTEGASSPQSQALLAGIGIRIGKPFHETVGAPSTRNLIVDQSVNLYVGTAIQNSFSSESDSGYQVEYRQNFAPTWEWSVAYSNEGSLGTFQRDGFVAQAWYGDWFLDQKLKLAFGAGPYVTNTRELDPQTREITGRQVKVVGRITVLVAYRTSRQVLLSAAWNRTATDDHKDTDLIVAGLGYAW